ncbi:reverse transcriptase domain-containing protein [Tanacetum coccineum]|uniref:Reverse transcriptase domain-containing protein n=1 Tax=Tanacetum coccineum TaxID=301880 RepID=A0ABQ5EHY8_9ASTR
MIRAIRINVPLVDVLAGMPNYDKFLKELVSNKYKLKQISSAFLSDESSALIQNKVPPKLGDLRSFLLPCNFNKAFSCDALADLCASINIMPYSLYTKLSLETLKPTKMSVRLADKSFQYPVGIAENILVEVGKFTFPVDFVILKMEEDSKVPLILGRPFLHTTDAVIRVKRNKLILDIDVIDEILEEDSNALLDEEPPTDLELKPQSDNLEYAYLEEPSILPIIISSQLLEQDKIKLIFVLKRHKQAFSWKTTDIPGICPSFCKHKIQLLEDKKPLVQKQRRLKPNRQEVVKKEIVKLLDTGIIYPITNSPWVSLIHCVPKKGGITVVTNEKDELVPTRTVISWRVCIDYRRLNESTTKDHFLLPFIDEMLERLAGNKYFCFLDGFFGYFQIPIDPMDQEKTTFACPFGTYAYRRMPFGLCNALATFQSPNWNLPFELMYDASDFVDGTVLGQKDGKQFHPIYFASKTLNAAQQKYTVTEKELMDVVFAFDKFRPYLILSKTIVYTDHSTLRRLFKKQDAMPRLIRWILLLQEFDIEIKDKKGDNKYNGVRECDLSHVAMFLGSLSEEGLGFCSEEGLSDEDFDDREESETKEDSGDSEEESSNEEEGIEDDIEDKMYIKNG